ncbi:alpha-2-macroglobulin family protein [Chitinophaga sp. sic0106]|uniref:alpha-2-macroglobulin family protein n=1 Tax=Chitinophaga sp. sic0106 TaxID=2854785 RepID=UPI001C47B819|nr:alpha-2-macroglobulin family protein [Chitinophaga sp. sic0106]MBV7529543.1 carboxypeptidase-like regulatory domain-containing protein [Chitinophaga sp. sic0106]
MKRILTAVLIQLTFAVTYAQQLSNSKTAGQTTALFSITDAEAAKLFQASLQVAKVSTAYGSTKINKVRTIAPTDALLHTFVRSWPANAPTPADIPAGHYLLVHGEKNLLRYEYYPVKNVRLHLNKNPDGRYISLTDKNSLPLSTPEVIFHRKQLPFQTAYQVYRLPRSNSKGVLKVKHEGVTNFFYVQEYKYFNTHWIARKWKALKTSHHNTHKGYLVTNKPKYKPGDTVRLKAFITNAKGTPVNTPLQLRLTKEDEDTILQVLHPYRPGAYEHSFVLTEALDLSLDNEYKLSLGTHLQTNRKKEFISRTFGYEAYELSQLTFSARSDKPAYSPGMPVKFFLKATDENNLPVLDGRVTVTVNIYSSSDYETGTTFIPEKLWQQEVQLEPTGETAVTVPDSIFPNATIQCRVRCELNSSSNDTKTENFYFSRKKTVKDIRFEHLADSIAISYTAGGLPQSTPARIIFYNAANDSTGQLLTTLPATIPASPYIARYTAVADDYTKSYDIKRNESGISFAGYRQQDSIFAHLENPHKVPVWYQVYAGKQQVISGKGTSFDWAAKAANTTYTLYTSFIYGDVSTDYGQYVHYLPASLDVKIQAPPTIQPGQTARITVAVSNDQQQPVADADVTAYAHTAKFNAADPEVPYLNRFQISGPKILTPMGVATKERYQENGPLNWSRWKTILGLDTMPYFRFFHPQGLLYNFEPAINGIAQVAPFVIKNNRSLIPQLVWINDNLEYVFGTYPDYPYSFRVTPGKQSIRIVTAEYEVVVDSVYAPEGMKTFISIPVDKPGPGITITPRKKPYFTQLEKSVLNGRLLVLNAEQNSTPQYVNNDGRIFHITPQHYRDVIVGPVLQSSSYYFASPLMHQQFDPEPGYRYTITKGLVKMEKVDLAKDYFSHRLLNLPDNPLRLNDYVLTSTDMDSLYNSHLESIGMKIQTYGSAKNNIRLLLPDSIQQQIRQVFVYKYDDARWLEMAEGRDIDIIRQPAGYYKLLVLMKRQGFVTLDSLQSKTGYESVYKYSQLNIQPDNDTVNRLRQRLNMAIITGNYEREFNPPQPKQPATYPDPKPVTNKGAGLTKLVWGTVRDSHGTPIPGASVMIQGTQIGTYTNEQGAYTLHVTETGTLAFNCIGYNMAIRMIRSDKIYDVMLFPREDALEEVVVMGYGTTQRKNLSATVSVTQSLQGRVAGVSVGAAKRKFFSGIGKELRIRGTGSTDDSKAPLLIVDGVPFNGTLADISEDLVNNMQVLSGDAAVAQYGDRAANGVVIITTNVKGGLKAPAVAEENLKAPLRHNFRDDAYWQPRLRTNENGEASFNVTFPDDITSWKSYALVAGNNKQSGFASTLIRAYNQVSANLALPQFTLAGDTLDVLTKIMNYNGDSIQVNRTLTVDGKQLKNGMLQLQHSLIETSTVPVPANDSLRHKFEMSNNDWGDGEYRAIPIYPAGTTEAFGQFFQLPGDTSLTLPGTRDTGAVHLYAATSAMPVLLKEAENLYTYRYDCNEQLASRLIAALLQKRWAAALDTNIHINKHIRNMISKLEKSRNMDGLWGWWANGATSGWISAHVLKAMDMAAVAGFRNKSDNKDLTRFLMPQIDKYSIDTRLDFLGYLRDTDSTFNLRAHVDTINGLHLTPIQQLRLLEIKQRAGITVSTTPLLQSVKKNLFGNTWWGPDSLDIYNSRIQYTLLAYRVLRREGGHDALLRTTRAWLLDQRGPLCWRNTYESATIMATIGDDILREQEQKAPLLQVNNTTVTRFPYETQLPAGQALSISKTGNRMLYLNTWQHRFNTNPARVDSAFKVRSVFKAGDTVLTTLTAGKKVTLEAIVEVKEDAGFVMIEVPIPAGCSYNGKPQPHSNSEVHREYYYEKVSIFCQYLHKGTYTFTIPLMPRYTGNFQLNPAKAEMMYFPVFHGREAMKRVPIK